MFRLARIPPWTAGWRVFTRPSRISGKPVMSETLRTGTPASFSVPFVPPVLKISTVSLANPRAKSTSPVLSETLRIARMVSPLSDSGYDDSLVAFLLNYLAHMSCFRYRFGELSHIVWRAYDHHT